MKNICNILATVLFAGLLFMASCRGEGSNQQAREDAAEANGDINATEEPGGNSASGSGTANETDAGPNQDTVTTYNGSNR